eukprot:TRINITY_DN4837_c1_g1_i1.p1 TRINITY_DN4837_c1_g1~~TRINITY_DN4837_c1_g1_i1.p1  ORF type:complete len:345 (+),score=119.22 TRINITY_DN4837_c1_g1_i1:43-1035(+)
MDTPGGASAVSDGSEEPSAAAVLVGRRYKGRTVLREEDFSERLSAVVEAQFFPDLARLRAEGRLIDGAALLKPAPAAQAADLDSFLDSHTGEEAVSFDLIRDADAAAHRRRWNWCHDGGSQLLLPPPPKKRRRVASTALVAAPAQPLKDCQQKDCWQTTAFNGPAPPKASTEPMGPPKSINLGATRLQRVLHGKLPAQGPVYMTQEDVTAAVLPERRGGLTSRDHDLVATPSMSPGPGASPFVTWGQVTGSPLVLAVDADEVAARLAGTQYSVPAESARDRHARKLADRAASVSRRSGSVSRLMDIVGVTPRGGSRAARRSGSSRAPSAQ